MMGPTRRRAILICAASVFAGRAGFASPQAYTWRGLLMGHVATLELHHPDIGFAKDVARRAVAEAQRLERIFSLYDPQSDLNRLNAAGFLLAPSSEMLQLLDRSAWAKARTLGLFDPTVQPLFDMQARAAAAGREAPAPDERAAALDLVGLDKVIWSKDRIVMRRGMKLTFNGIAQGYVSDRVADLLAAQGFKSCLIDMGEPRLLGARPDGSAWRVSLDGDGAGVALRSGAVATTRPDGFRFPGTKASHVFHPGTGVSASGLRSISIAAPDATTADALSTGLALHEPSRIPALVEMIGGARLVDLQA